MQLTLPSNSEAWVEVDPTRVLVEDAGNIVSVVYKAVTGWNLVDSENQPLPLSEESLGKLPYTDIKHIAESLKLKPDTQMLQEVILAINDTDSANKLPVPIEYILFKYRKEMGLTYQEIQSIPLYILNQDIEFISLENQARNYVGEN